MKIQRNAGYTYRENNISEDNGYIKWYDWNIVKKHTGMIYLIFWVILTVWAILFRSYLIHYGIIELFASILLAIVAWLFIITPIHEILHLLPLPKGKIDDKCVITIGNGTVSALYNGLCSRNRKVISLMLPFLSIGTILLCLVFLTSGLLRLFFIFLLIVSCYGSYTDIYMVFYVIKHIKKDELIFGLYKKRTES